jgi:hypothetical protein
MSLIIPANSLAGGGYEVDNSLRFNDGSSDYLSRTPASTGNRKTFTISTWIKLGKIQTSGAIFSARSGSPWGILNIGTGDGVGSAHSLQFTVTAGVSPGVYTSQIFRDPSAWYHIVCAVDTTQATDSNRVKIYINGIQSTLLSGNYPTLNQDTQFNSTIAHYVGGEPTSSNYFDGSMSHVHFIDGQQLTPTDFGEFDADSGVWKPIVYEGTYGTNGFFLEFQDSGALGTDTSGNGNNFTVNNLTSIDQTTDTPTNNFCTWNAISAPYSAPTLSEGNLKVTNNSANWQGAIGTFGVSQGKWYWEARFDTTTFTYNHGVIDESVNFSAINPMNATGYTGWYNTDGGEMKKDATDTTADYGTFGTNDIIGIALNMDDKQISIYKNGTIHVSNFALSTTSTLVFPCTVYYSSGVCSYNFGNPPYTITTGNADANGYGNFEYAVPTGYLSLCTKNLSEVNS